MEVHIANCKCGGIAKDDIINGRWHITCTVCGQRMRGRKLFCGNMDKEGLDLARRWMDRQIEPKQTDIESHCTLINGKWCEDGKQIEK